MGEKKSLDILYDAMQRPVGDDQRAYSTGMLRQHNGKGVFLSDDHARLSYLQTLKNRSIGLHLFTMRHAHLLEIRKLQLTVKSLVHKGVDYYVQNALKLTYDHL